MLEKIIAGIRVSRHTISIGASAAALMLLASPAAARRPDISLKLEPGFAIPLSAPQSTLYDVGGSQSLKLLFGLTPYLDIGPTASFLMLPASEPLAESGVVWGLGGGLRLKRPWDARSAYGISPWLDADLLYMRTGALNRPGFDAAVGLAIPTNRTRTFWVGPFVRYLQTFQGERAGFDNRDAKILILGVSLEVGSGIERARSYEDSPPTTSHVVVNQQAACPDTAKDGLSDEVDRCPEVAGAIDSWGCPKYQKVVVERDKLELKERVYFAWDSATIEEASFPVLDEVVQALKDNKGFRVQVEGHADSSGGDDHNQRFRGSGARHTLHLVVHDGGYGRRRASNRHLRLAGEWLDRRFARCCRLGEFQSADGPGDARRHDFHAHARHDRRAGHGQPRCNHQHRYLHARRGARPKPSVRRVHQRGR